MAIISALVLLLLLASLIFALITLIRMLNKGATTTAALKKRSKLYLLVSVAVCVVCLAFLFFSGKIYSMSMTIQMPNTVRIQSTGSNRNPDRAAIRLSTDEDFALTGDKAVTFHTGTGPYTNFGQELVLLADSFIVERIFQYSDQYIPREYRAANASEVGFIVFVEHYASFSGQEYTNGAKAFSHDVDVTICSDSRILAESTIRGGLYHETGGEDTLGPAPDKEVSEWVAAQLEQLCAERAAAVTDSPEEDSEPSGANSESQTSENGGGALTAADYAASIERAAADNGISLTPDANNGGTFYVYSLSNSVTGNDGLDFEEQSAGLFVRTSLDKNSYSAVDTVEIYSLALHAAGVTGRSSDILSELLSTLLELPNDNGASITLEYPDDNLIVEIVPRAEKWIVNFTFS